MSQRCALGSGVSAHAHTDTNTDTDRQTDAHTQKYTSIQSCMYSHTCHIYAYTRSSGPKLIYNLRNTNTQGLQF